MQRILYYHSTMITERLYPRESYGEIPKTYVIFICLFDWYRARQFILWGQLGAKRGQWA